jgi:glycosyltransferase involved in cell wall biosynthesis
MRRIASHTRSDAEITLYRPSVRNVFGLQPDKRAGRTTASRPLRLVALGTVEPRKNFKAAAALLQALRGRGFADATLDIVGRRGWGDDWTALETMPGVTLHDYQPTERVKELLDAADLFVCTSHDEGLGLPLLEAQYAGLPIAAPDAPIFREVLDASGIFINPADPTAGAAQIAATLSIQNWRAGYVTLAEQNLGRWNTLAHGDREAVIELISRLAAQPFNSGQFNPKRI